jgi:hypothetical protein
MATVVVYLSGRIDWWWWWRDLWLAGESSPPVMAGRRSDTAIHWPNLAMARRGDDGYSFMVT